MIKSLVAVSFVLIVGLAACGAEPASTPVPTELPSVQPAIQGETPEAERLLSTGQELFVSKGCSACHGQNAEGTEIAPPLAGHTAAVVKRQARAPLGIMPVFPPDKLSNEELDAIAEFIGGLGGEHVHVRAPGPDALALHHWMALFSIEAGDTQEAAHHLGHIVGVTEGEHRSRMKQAVALLEEGDADEATHIIEAMLAGLGEVDLDEPTIHLTLALSSARVDEADVAAQHVLHFVQKATGQRLERGEAILTLLDQGDVREAERELEQLLGEDAPAEEHEEEAPQGEDHEAGTDSSHGG